VEREVFKSLKGTTTIGMVCKDGIVLATDKRATAGLFVAHKHVRKIVRIDERIVMTIAGSVADAQMLTNGLKVEAMLYRKTYGRPISVKALATMASNMLFSRRYLIPVVQAIIAGVDDSGPRMFMLDMFGTLTEEDKYIATGSGTPYAVGFLEENYRSDITVKEAIELAKKAILTAQKWDPGSGGGYDIVAVTKDEFIEITSEKGE